MTVVAVVSESEAVVERRSRCFLVVDDGSVAVAASWLHQDKLLVLK